MNSQSTQALNGAGKKKSARRGKPNIEKTFDKTRPNSQSTQALNGAGKKKRPAERGKTNLEKFFDKTRPNSLSWIRRALKMDRRAKNVDIANRIMSLPTNEFLLALNGTHAITSNLFWRALFEDMSPELYKLFLKVKITEGARKFYRDHNPVSHRVENGEKVFRYRFWEYLYVECERMLQQEDVRGVLEYLMNDSGGPTPAEVRDTMWKILEFPFVALFLALRFTRFRTCVAYNNDSVYNYLPLRDDRIEIELRSGAPVVARRVVGLKSFSRDRRSSAISGAVTRGFPETLELLVDQEFLDNGENKKNFETEFCSASQEVTLFVLQKGWIRTADLLQGWVNSSLRRAFIRNVLSRGMEAVYRRDPLFDTFSVERWHILFAIDGGSRWILRQILSRVSPELLRPDLTIKLVYRAWVDILAVVIKHPTATVGMTASSLIDAYEAGAKKGVVTICESGALQHEVSMSLYEWAFAERLEPLVEALSTFSMQNVASLNYAPLVIAWSGEKREIMMAMCRKVHKEDRLSMIGTLVLQEEYGVAVEILSELDLTGLSKMAWGELQGTIINKDAHRVLEAFPGDCLALDDRGLLPELYEEKKYECLKVIVKTDVPGMAERARRLLNVLSPQGSHSGHSGVSALLHNPTIIKNERKRREDTLSALLASQGAGEAARGSYSKDLGGLLDALRERDVWGLICLLEIPELNLRDAATEILAAALEWDDAVLVVILLDLRMVGSDENYFVVSYYVKTEKWKLATFAIDDCISRSHGTHLVTAMMKKRDPRALRYILSCMKSPTFDKSALLTTDRECLALAFSESGFHIEPLMFRFAEELVAERPEIAMDLLKKASTLLSEDPNVTKSDLNQLRTTAELVLGRLKDWTVSEGAVMSIIKTCDLSEYLEKALDEGVDPSSQNNDALFVATRKNMKKVIKRLMNDPRVDPSACESSAFQVACRFADAEIVKLFLDDGRSNPAANSSQGLINAAYAGKEDVVAMLLGHEKACSRETCGGEDCRKICPRARRRLAGRSAVLNGHLDIFDMLGK